MTTWLIYAFVILGMVIDKPADMFAALAVAAVFALLAIAEEIRKLRQEDRS